MPLSPGSRLGPYDIQSAIGAGGMGEVYKARDTRLDRDVAIKILPAAFASDPDRIARFQREAKTLAALNHPNIAQIFGLEEAGDLRALAMELVAGEDLSDRIARSPIPIDEALPIARQIADALEAAHEQGIIHRDLKPANIKVREDGTVKVLDFGLAKLTEPAAASSGAALLSQSPTITTPAMTGVGVILGTAAYMSPEQAKGRPADKRSDIWAFGCLLFEMLTGKRAFEGEDVSDTLAAVLRGVPDWTLLATDVPISIRTLVQRCLEKDRHKRIADISTARFLMSEPAIVTSGPPAALSASQRPLWRRLVPIAVAAIVAAAMTGIAMRFAGRATTTPGVTRWAFTLPDGQQFSGVTRQVIAISPDGSQVVYVANARLYVRSMTDFEPRAIPGTEMPAPGLTNPVFSPDGRSVAFYSAADQTLKRIATTGGVPNTICQVETPPVMTWTHDSILFGQPARGILRVSSNGGKPELVASSTRGEGLIHPQMLPGDQAVLFTVVPGGILDNAQVAVQSLVSGQRKILTEGSDAFYLTTGHIVYWQGGTIFAAPFDVSGLRLVGAPVPVVQGVQRVEGSIAANFSVSETGSLIYIPGPTNGSSSRRAALVLVDRTGHEEMLKVPSGPYEGPRFSPDGKLVAVGTDDGKDSNIWVYSLSGTTLIRQLTFGGRNRYPVWAANGERIAFQSDREGDLAIFWQRADGTDTAERLTKADPGISHVPESWSQAGERLSFSATGGETASLWTVSVQEKKAVPFGDLRSRAPLNSTFSPDGRWLAYTLRGARATVHVQPFPPTGAQYQINDAHHPMWSRDGKELFYMPIANTTGLIAVSFTPQPSPTFGVPVAMFSTEPGLFVSQYGGQRNHDIAPDGKSFIAVGGARTQSGVPAAPEIRVVLNWTEELKQRVPTR